MYILLRDSFGRGLEQIPGIELEVFPDVESLEDAVIRAAQSAPGFVDSEDLEDVAQSLVICELTEQINGVDPEKFIERVLKGSLNKERDERYRLYLELKEEFGQPE